MQAIKEELEEMIEQVKHDVDKKDKDIAEIKRRQDESFDLLSFKMENLKKDFKELSIEIILLIGNIWLNSPGGDRQCGTKSKRSKKQTSWTY